MIIKLANLLSVAICVLLLLGCGGGSPTDAGLNGESSDTPRQVLTAFGDACINADIDSACNLMQNPARWRKSFELAHDVLPILGDACNKAEETNRERDCVRYRIRLRHPDDPQKRVLENRIFVRRVRDIKGKVGDWRVDFINPGDGLGQMKRQRDRLSQTEISPDDRTGQWGTMYTHASVITRAILAYYFLMYPDDYKFNNKLWGYLNPYLYHYSVKATHPGDIESILGIGYDTYDNIPPDAVIIANFASALIQAGSADEDVFTGELNGDGTVNYLRDIVLTTSGGIKFSATTDFGDDDDTFLKGFGHFLTPITQNAYETDFSKFNDNSVLSGIGSASVGALDWAMGNGSMGPYDILGIVGMREARNRKTFYRAVDLMRQALHERNGFIAAEKAANAFYTFGFTLHLLEDQTCPAHVRNDMHGVPIISSIPGLGGLQPDPAEEWAETITSSFVNETIGLYSNLLKEHSPIVGDSTGFPGNSILQNLYANAAYTDYPAVEALFEYTSLMTNRMCFSEDTIYTSTNYDAANTDYYPDLNALNLDFFGRTVVYGTPGSPISSESYLAACGNGMFDVWRSWFWSTHWFSDPDINDVEDALYGGWDILTMDDDEDDDYFSNSVLGVREQQWRLMFPLIVKTGAAYMHEYYVACTKPGT